MKKDKPEDLGVCINAVRGNRIFQAYLGARVCSGCGKKIDSMMGHLMGRVSHSMYCVVYREDRDSYTFLDPGEVVFNYR